MFFLIWYSNEFREFRKLELLEKKNREMTPQSFIYMVNKHKRTTILVLILRQSVNAMELCICAISLITYCPTVILKSSGNMYLR